MDRIVRDLEVLGELIVEIEDTAARTDAAKHGTLHFYRTGATIVMQMYDARHATPAWRSTTLT